METFRQVAAWWLWGPSAARTATTLARRCGDIKPLFAVCSKNGIRATELSRFPLVIAEVGRSLSKAGAPKALGLLHLLSSARDVLGFEILDSHGLKLLSEQITSHEHIQSAYIPPRIWSYVVLRLGECLDDYLKHADQFDACFRECVSEYLYAMPIDPSERRYLFKGSSKWLLQIYTRITNQSFITIARKHGVYDLIARWLPLSDRSGMKSLGNFLSLISFAGLGYSTAFSLMRIDEASQLRANCLRVERDGIDDDVYSLCGPTTKTQQDEEAHWIVPQAAERAVDAMSRVARLRSETAALCGASCGDQHDLANPLLQNRSVFPWAVRTTGHHRKTYRQLSEAIRSFTLLFDSEQLRITETDHAIAMSMTHGLDPTRYFIGAIWPFSWHQFRRTGACNMLSSGLVSEVSSQYQLKHASRMMSRYYGQNHYRLKSSLNDEARGFYLAEMYRSFARTVSGIDDNFISPHGSKRAAHLIEIVSSGDHKLLAEKAAQGKISYRENFLGGCAKQGELCPWGGISNIHRCLGSGVEKACEDVLVDKRKRPIIVKLADLLKGQLDDAPLGSPLRASLEANLESANRALNVIDSN